MVENYKKKQILIVDDERDLSETLAEFCQLSGFTTHISENGHEGLLRCYSLEPDLVILDMNLPDFDGLDVIKEIRTKSKVPLIVLSGRTEKCDRILAIEFGADDYITKPYDSLELISRVKAIIRRVDWLTEGSKEYSKNKETLEINFPWYVDFSRMCIRSENSNQEISLTNRETEIFKRFADKSGSVIDKATLLSAIGYPRDYDQGPLEVCLSRLKAKLAKQDIPYPIESVRGVGYKFVQLK